MDKDYFNFLGQNIGEEKKETSQKTQAMANIAIRVDADCLLLCDGEYLDVQLEAGKITKIQLPIGQHLLEFLYTEDPDIKVEKDDADFPESGKSYFVNIKGLKAAVDIAMAKVKAKEEETKHLAEEKKRQDEEILKAEKLKEQEQEIKELVRKGKECYNNHGYEAAFKYFKQASEYGDPEAQYELGLCFFEGKGVDCDINEAINMWKLSAEQGFVIAQYRLGMEIPDEFLEDDEKVKEGMKWLEMAAKQGYSEAQWQLSNFYATDWLSVYDPLLATQWMKAAAEQGHVEAIEALKFRG